MRKMQRFNILLSIAALGCAFVATSASATPPTKTHISFTGFSMTDTAYCGVPIDLVVLVGEVDETLYFDKDGTLIMVHDHYVQQNQYSANGKTLTGIPFQFNVQTFIKAGVVTQVLDGVIEKVPLPDGGLFLAAGRADLTGMVWGPDHGAFKNLDGFCAALAP